MRNVLLIILGAILAVIIIVGLFYLAPILLPAIVMIILFIYGATIVCTFLFLVVEFIKCLFNL